MKRSFGIVLPNVSKDFIESFFKWISYNAVVALVIKAGASLAMQENWWALLPLTLFNMLLLDLTFAYGLYQVVNTLLDTEQSTKSKAHVGRWIVTAGIFILQLILWKVFGAFA